MRRTGHIILRISVFLLPGHLCPLTGWNETTNRGHCLPLCVRISWEARDSSDFSSRLGLGIAPYTPPRNRICDANAYRSSSHIHTTSSEQAISVSRFRCGIYLPFPPLGFAVPSLLWANRTSCQPFWFSIAFLWFVPHTFLRR